MGEQQITVSIRVKESGWRRRREVADLLGQTDCGPAEPAEIVADRSEGRAQAQGLGKGGLRLRGAAGGQRGVTKDIVGLGALRFEGERASKGSDGGVTCGVIEAGDAEIEPCRNLRRSQAHGLAQGGDCFDVSTTDAERSGSILA
jgi:hypothetical protein